MHLFCSFLRSSQKERAHKFVFFAAGDPVPAVPPASPEAPNPFQNQLVDLAQNVQQTQVPQAAAEVKDKSAEEQRALREQLDQEQIKKLTEKEIAERLERAEHGSAKDYADYFEKQFQKTEGLDDLSLFFKEGQKIEGPFHLINYHQWVGTDPAQVAEFLKCLADRGLMPIETGFKPFLDGLRNGETPDPNDTSKAALERNQRFAESYAALERIVAVLHKKDESEKKTSENTAQAQEKKPFGETANDAVKTLAMNYKKASGQEKALILASIGIGLGLIWKYRNETLPFFKNYKMQDLYMFLGAAWGVNYMSGKMAKDGKTLLQRIDLGRSIDELEDDNVHKRFALDADMGKDELMMKTYIELQDVNLKDLYLLYKEASTAANPEKAISESRLRDIGVSPDKVDRKKVFELMEKFVQQVGVHEGTLEEGGRRGPDFKGASKVQQDLWKTPGKAQAYFEAKYLRGPLSEFDLSLKEGVFVEYRGKEVMPGFRDDAAWTSAFQQDRRERLIDKGAAAAVSGAKEGARIAGDAAEVAWDRTKKAAKWVRSEFLGPAGEALMNRIRKHSPLLTQPINNTIKEYQKKSLDEVLPKNFNTVITENDALTPFTDDIGKATIMGIPQVAFTTKVNAAGKNVVIIDSEEFVVDAGLTGNATQIKQLQDKLTLRAQQLIDNAGKSIPAPKSVQWNATKNRWFVTGIKVTNHPDVPPAFIRGGNRSVSFTLDADGNIDTYYLGETEIKDWDELPQYYAESEVTKMITEDPRFFGPPPRPQTTPLEGMPVTDVKFKKHLTYGVIITGKLAGLPFTGYSNMSVGGSGQFDFLDTSVSPPVTRGINVLELDPGKNETVKFLDTLWDKIYESDDFQTPYRRLETVMLGTSEGVLSRVELAWNQKSPISGLNGAVHQRRWQYLVGHKMSEVLDNFRYELLNTNGGTKTVFDVDRVYTTVVKKAMTEMVDLAKKIEGMTEEQRAEKFNDLYDELETNGYENDEYRDLFKKYKALIEDPKYDLEGLESLHDVGTDTWGAADDAFDTRQTLMRAWSYWTHKFRTEDPDLAAANAGTPYPHVPDEKEQLHPSNREAIQKGVIDWTKNILEKRRTDYGKIRRKDLPEHDDVSDWKDWADPTWINRLEVK